MAPWLLASGIEEHAKGGQTDAKRRHKGDEGEGEH